MLQRHRAQNRLLRFETKPALKNGQAVGALYSGALRTANGSWLLCDAYQQSRCVCSAAPLRFVPHSSADGRYLARHARWVNTMQHTIWQYAWPCLSSRQHHAAAAAAAACCYTQQPSRTCRKQAHPLLHSPAPHLLGASHVLLCRAHVPPPAPAVPPWQHPCHLLLLLWAPAAALDPWVPAAGGLPPPPRCCCCCSQPCCCCGRQLHPAAAKGHCCTCCPLCCAPLLRPLKCLAELSPGVLWGQGGGVPHLLGEAAAAGVQGEVLHHLFLLFHARMVCMDYFTVRPISFLVAGGMAPGGSIIQSGRRV
jgi:hypothetical protein